MSKIPAILVFICVTYIAADPCDHFFASEKAKENFNKRTVLAFYREAFSNPQNFEAAAKKYLAAEGYIQHSPNFPDGRQGLIDGFTQYFGASTRNPILHIAHAGADGDLVWIHELDLDPRTNQLSVILNLYRLECGIIHEHWDITQPIQPNATYANSHPFF